MNEEAVPQICVKGKCLGFSETSGNFTYAYHCSSCYHPYHSSAPEETVPLLCHQCGLDVEPPEWKRPQVPGRKRDPDKRYRNHIENQS
jgi:hypothetical protein